MKKDTKQKPREPKQRKLKLVRELVKAELNQVTGGNQAMRAVTHTWTGGCCA